MWSELCSLWVSECKISLIVLKETNFKGIILSSNIEYNSFHINMIIPFYLSAYYENKLTLNRGLGGI